MPKIAIIIPCYNEEKRLSFENIKELIESSELQIFFANDGSTDNTKQLINSICNQIPRCEAIHFDENEGKSTTIYKAIHYIVDQNLYDYIGYFDADFSTPVNELLQIVNRLNSETIPFIFASRIKTLNAKITRKVHRHIIGRTILSLINFKHHLAIYDTQCGCKIFSKDIIKVGFKDPFLTSWLFDVEIFIRLKNEHLLKTGIEHPIKHWTDVEGSKLKLNHFPKIIKEIFTLYIKYN